MIKNKKDRFEVKWEVRNKGNWNFRNDKEISLNTKPIAVILIDQDEFVFQHYDIMQLIRAYHEVDKASIDMIKKGQAGSVKNAEASLLDKLKLFIKELEQEDKCIQDSKFLKDGQKALRVE